MSAQIKVFPIGPAAWDNTDVHDFAKWYATNEAALLKRFDQVGRYITPEGDDFFGYAVCQHDLAVIRTRGA